MKFSFVFLFFFLLIHIALSQNIETSVNIDTLRIIKDTLPDFTPEITISKIPNDKIEIDGKLNEKEWETSAKITTFYEIEPGDNVKPSVNTETLICYDENNLYVGFICYEDNINKIRKTLIHRDETYNDDYVGIIIDTYGEGKQAYELFVNPYGVQGDLMWNTPGNEDVSFDAIWYSEASVNQNNWVAEIAVPFKSIRFPQKNVQEWKIHINRNRPRENKQEISWAAVSRNAPTLFTNSGTLKGIENIKSGNNLEILPSFVSSQAGNISDYSNANSEFVNEKIKGKFGLNIKYGISSTLTADLTFNPDFSQVETDEGIINVNNTYAYSYTEKRPFFIEGINIFSTPFNVVYTRMINNPLTAFKFSGKIGRIDIGYLAAYDKKTPFIIPFEDNSDFLNSDRKSISNIMRIKYTIKDETFFGFIFTDREVNYVGNDFINIDGYNRVFGLDGNIKLFGNYFFDFQILRYVTKEITDTSYKSTGTFDNGKYTNALDGESFSGFGTHLKLLKSAKHWNFSISYDDASPVARRDNGYISNNNYRTLFLRQSYMFYPETDFLQRIQPGCMGIVRHTYDGKLKELFLDAELWFRFKHQISASASIFIVNNEEFKGVYHQGARRFSLNVDANTFNFISGGFGATIGKYIIRFGNPYVGYGGELEGWLSLIPLENLTINTEYSYFELAKSYGGEKLFAGYILRNTLNYYFIKDLSLRIITEYSSSDKYFYVNPLISYQPNPFTIFYFGFTHQYNNLEIPPSEPDYYPQSKYTLSTRQFFLKLQYLFRL